MNVVALTRTSRIGPSTRYRIEQYVPLLEEKDIHVTCLPLFGRTWFAILEWRPGRLRTLVKGLYSLARLVLRVGQIVRASLGGADLVLVEQQLFPYLPAWIELALWPRRQPTILEFDDAIYLTFAHQNKLARLCGRASLVIVGNRFLERFAARSAQTVVVIPTTVDVARAARGGRREDGVFRVVWIGLRYNLDGLDRLAEPLTRLAREGVTCEFVVISSAAPEPGPRWEGVHVVHRPWSEETEGAEIARCDVGVMPLLDNEWNRGKCALKLLQYMAAGLPVVASPVGVNADIIRHGENGLLASDTEEWTACLRSLHADPQLSSRLGEAGWKTVLEGYSIERGAHALAETYRRALDTAGGGMGAERGARTP